MHNTTDFEEFVRARSPRLLRTAVLLCADVQTAEDILQTALWRTFRRWRSARDNPDAYVRVVLVNLAHDDRRNRMRRPQQAELTDRAAASDADGVASILERDVLFAALQQLPYRQRATVVLRFWDDFSVEDTAAILRCSTGTVKSATSKALVQLRRLLASEIADDERQGNVDTH